MPALVGSRRAVLAAPNTGGGFSLPAFMAGQSDGFWYDFSKTDRLFQENVGPTPAAVANDVIGLALSQRLWNGQTLAAYLAQQTEKRGTGAPVLAGSATAATFDTTTGVGSATRVDFNNQSGVAITGLVGGRTYAVDITAPLGLLMRDGATPLGATLNVGAVAGRYTYYVTPTAAATAFCITAAATPNTANFTLHSVKEVSRYLATQAPASLKPKYQTTGAAFDGLDDNLLTGYMAGAGANFVVAKVSVPATLASAQFIAGATGAGALPAFVLGFNTSGLLVGGVGTQSINVIVGSSGDLRGTTAVVGISFDGTTVKLFANSAEVYSQPQAGGAPTLTVPVYLGCRNVDGTAQSFFAGSIKNIVAGRQALGLATFNKIAAAL